MVGHGVLFNGAFQWSDYNVFLCQLLSYMIEHPCPGKICVLSNQRRSSGLHFVVVFHRKMRALIVDRLNRRGCTEPKEAQSVIFTKPQNALRWYLSNFFTWTPFEILSKAAAMVSVMHWKMAAEELTPKWQPPRYIQCTIFSCTWWERDWWTRLCRDLVDLKQFHIVSEKLVHT